MRFELSWIIRNRLSRVDKTWICEDKLPKSLTMNPRVLYTTFDISTVLLYVDMYENTRSYPVNWSRYPLPAVIFRSAVSTRNIYMMNCWRIKFNEPAVSDLGLRIAYSAGVFPKFVEYRISKLNNGRLHRIMKHPHTPSGLRELCEKYLD